MGLISNQTIGAAISDVFIGGAQSLGQIQKIVLQRRYSTGVTPNEFVVATENPNILASWTPYYAVTDDSTKMVTSPQLSAPESEPGGAREYGGGNETVGDIPLILGRKPSMLSFNILQANQRTIKDMKKYQVEEIGVYLLDEFNQIAMIADDPETPVKLSPIPIFSLFVSDLIPGGLETPDMNTMSFKLYPNWSDNMVLIKATDFNPLRALVQP